MAFSPTSQDAPPNPADMGKRAGIILLRLSPWVVFGPITGVLSEMALRAYRKQKPIVAGLYVVLNIGILVAIPTLTAFLAARL
ncbi:hypothetical protein [Phenylobacterium sp.]|uniref:hypothetical protein n=1 Tax=Phenylobacterium sp. TaxID=1871053 RepID=UPI002735D3CC|nr:hypothetical protein [Phenylobacterium sp.]MDP3855084.1 hypothetical protein [Phenylobacterium sp.]